MSFFIIAGIYILSIIGLSYFISIKETREDFLIGGRRLGALSLAISLSTTWLGGGMLVLMVYFALNDLPAFLFLMLGCVSNLLVMSFFVKKPYELAKENNWITMTEMVKGTIGNKSAKFVLFFVLILFSSWLLFEMVGSSRILSNITPFSYLQSVILMASVICIYLCLGGFKSLIRTDLIQYGLMIFMLLACFYLVQDAPEIDLKPYVTDKPSMSLNGFLAGFFGFFALQFSESTIWQRIFAAKSAKDAQKALIYTGGFYIVTNAVILSLIILGGAFAPELQDEKIFSFLAYEKLPNWLGSLFLVSLLAIIMSTIDSVLFIAAQCFSTDFAHVFDKELPHPRKSVRIATVAITAVVLVISLLTQDIEGLFWFILALWAAIVPICYMFLPVKKVPSDTSVCVSMSILAAIIIILYAAGSYQEHYIAYMFFAGLALPPLLDRIFQKKAIA